jgi:hypothetical protein
MRWLAIVLAGCASAGSPGQSGVDSNTGGGGSDSGGTMIDGSTMSDSSMVMIDAPPGPQTRTLTQTTSQTIKAGNTIACGGSGTTRANNYYRVFDLPAMGINTAFNLTKVSFQVEDCVPVSGTACTNVAVRVGTYSATPAGTLNSANMTILASNPTVAVPKVVENAGPPPTTPGATVDVPITATIPAGSKLLVEIDAPDGTNTYRLYLGSNDGGESGFGYILAPATGCAITTPTNISAVGGAMYPAVHLLITATGTY